MSTPIKLILNSLVYSVDLGQLNSLVVREVYAQAVYFGVVCVCGKDIQ